MKAYLEIEMPTSCCECAIKSWDGEDDVCPFSGISALSIGRQDDCPLVPVPPHGRLIDADELLEHVWRDKLDSRELIAKMIDNAQTVIPAEDGE